MRCGIVNYLITEQIIVNLTLFLNPTFIIQRGTHDRFIFSSIFPGQFSYYGCVFKQSFVAKSFSVLRLGPMDALFNIDRVA